MERGAYDTLATIGGGIVNPSTLEKHIICPRGSMSMAGG
jgi:hypothetical protein